MQTFLTIAGWTVSGVLAVIGAFNLQSQKNRSADESTSQNLINNLKTTTEIQDKELQSLRAKEVEQGKEIAHLQGQVKVLTEILQGRDPRQAKLFEEAPAIFEIARENNTLSKKNGESIDNLTKALTELLTEMKKAIPPQA